MSPAEKLGPLGRSVPGGKILAVYLDDEPDVLAALAPLLESYGFEVFATSSPDEALEVARRDAARLGLIVSDFSMPELDGFAFRARVLEAGARAPFVIFSGCLTKEMALRAIELKIAGFIEKPAVAADFEAIISREVVPFASTLAEEAELLQGFLADARNLIEELETQAEDLAREPGNRDVLNSLFGTAHTLKGASGFFEPRTLHHYVHKLEDHLKRLQNSAAPPAPHELDAVIHAVDVASDLLQTFSDPAAAADEAALNAELDGLFAAAPRADEATSSRDVTAAGERRETKDTFIKVETGLIDEFLKTSGELTIIRNMLKRTAQTLGRQFGATEEIQQLHDLLEELHRANGLMQRRVHEIRKVTLASVLKPLPRVVRDVSQTLGKKVRLDTSGAHGRIDLTVGDVIGKCIIHLIKNSIDHGLEPPARRRELGKTEDGLIQITADVTDDGVKLVIRDDGAGLNVERIRRKLLDNGFDPAAVNAMSERDVHQMIFSPGFSTAAQTTELSGRGVGMSMVEETVKSIGGSIRVESESGRGSAFTLVLPAPKSVLIKSCLLVRLGPERFGLDQESIVQVIDARGSHTYQREDSAGVPLLRGAEGLLPLLDARALLGFGARDADATDPRIVIIQSEHHGRFGLLIDEVLDLVDAVVKDVPAFVNRAELYAGATFLEDRSVGLLIGSDGLAAHAGLSRRMLGSAPPALSLVTSDADAEPTWITFADLAGERRAIRQEQISRIVLLRPETLAQSGGRMLMRDGDRLLPLIESEDQTTPRSLAANLPILIIRIGDVPHGLVVAEILEVVCARPAAEVPAQLLTAAHVFGVFAA